MCLQLDVNDGDEWVGTIRTRHHLQAVGLQAVDYAGLPVDCEDDDDCLCGIDVGATLDAAGVPYQRAFDANFDVQVADMPHPEVAADVARREAEG